MKTSIIILNWNTLEWLKRCVNSVKRNTEDYELILVDNGSKNQKEVKEYIKSVTNKYIFNKENKGFSGGNNQGFKLAEGEYVCFLNNDTIVTGDWLDEMLKTFDSNSKCGAVGPLGNPRLKLSQDGNQVISLNQYIGQVNKDTKTNFLSGYCFLTKREIYDKYKFDEEFKIGYFEDNFLCEELIKAEYELFICANSFVWHLSPGASFEKSNLDVSQIYNDNRIRFAKKMVELHGRR